jgi:hypothetical protein
VPLVPSIPDDVSDAGKSPAKDAELFPSDEQLSQRSLWLAFLIALGFTILGLAGALPMYLVSLPCLAQSTPWPVSGMLSTVHDLSLLRLLALLEDGNATYVGLRKRLVVGGRDLRWNARTRLIVLTGLTILLGVLPALIKCLKQFNKMVAYRERWLNVRCDRQDLGWLSIRYAPGFRGWGEKRLKDFILKSGLSSSLDAPRGRNPSRSRHEYTEGMDLSHGEEAQLEVDVQNLFSIGCVSALPYL